FRQWSDDIVYFAHTNTPPTEEESEQLAARGIRVVPGEIASVEVTADHLSGVRLTDGTVIPREILAAPTHMKARPAFLTDLGLTPPLGLPPRPPPPRARAPTPPPTPPAAPKPPASGPPETSPTSPPRSAIPPPPAPWQAPTSTPTWSPRKPARPSKPTAPCSFE